MSRRSARKRVVTEPSAEVVAAQKRKAEVGLALLAAAVVVHEHGGRCGCVQKADNPNLCSHCKLFFALLRLQEGVWDLPSEWMKTGHPEA